MDIVYVAVLGVAVLLGIWKLLTYVSGLLNLDERKLTLQEEADYVSARMLDTWTIISSTPAQRGNERKRDDDLSNWMAEGKKLVKEARHFISQIESWRCYLLGAKMRWEVGKLLESLKDHVTKGHQLLGEALSDARGPCHGYHIPVNQIIGQVASETWVKLKHLLEDDVIGRIAIRGKGGSGKTFFMKHLHNWALNRFDYVFWVPSPVELTVKSVQDAVAEVVHCDFDSDDALSVRAKKLSDALYKLGTFAIFLDGAPKSDISLDQIGIPMPTEGFKCKLVLSTISSTLDCRMLNSFESVEIEDLTAEDAYDFFMHKANIGEGSVTSLNNICRSIVNSCNGVPRLIENTATRMCGIDDLHEWRNAEFELVGPGMLIPVPPG